MRRNIALLLALLLTLSLLCACAAPAARSARSEDEGERDLTGYLLVLEDEPDTCDFQCTSIHYTVAQNVFNRLVEMETDDSGSVTILPSLARTWEVSDDRRCYTFHLRENVTFSNGSPLTATDVEYSFTRLLTHPDACNGDIVESILGAAALQNGETDRLEGFQVLGELDFSITLEAPFGGFLACMSMPGASILDEESTEAAGADFGVIPECTVGTGSFIWSGWEHGKDMLFTANADCWLGAPRCAGVYLRFVSEAEEAQMLFDNGELDILDLDELGNVAEFYYHGDVYQNRLRQVQQIGITYIALNQSIEPLNDVRVRKALQLSLHRSVLLDTVFSGRGLVENGIFPHGLNGFNKNLPEIPYDLEQAQALLAEAGYPEGFHWTVSVKSSATQWELGLMTLAASMWDKIGIQTDIQVLEESEFMRLRKSGELACYPATWTADYNDPDNFIYTFFGTWENTVYRSLCYGDEAVMERVRKARSIIDPEQRLAEYQALEAKIVQEDAGWIPLFSRQRYYVISERLEGFRTSWNGSVKNNYRNMYVGS